MISAESAIRAMRRDLTLASALKLILGGAAVACVLAGQFLGGWPMTLAVLLILGVWLALGYTSAKRSSLAADSPMLIATGQFEEAEQKLEPVLRGFSIFRSAKLMSLHHLTVLRHAQHRWAESALLCQALLRQRLVGLGAVARSTRLMLADALLEMNDLAGAYEAILDLYHQRLSLSDSLNLLLVQLDYESRIGAWGSMMRGLPVKVQMAELMPATPAAKAQALLALAARRTHRDDWANWLIARADLLEEREKLLADRPDLREAWGAEPLAAKPA